MLYTSLLGLQVPNINPALMDANNTLHGYDVRTFISSVSVVIWEEWWTPHSLNVFQSMFILLFILCAGQDGS